MLVLMYGFHLFGLIFLLFFSREKKKRESKNPLCLIEDLIFFVKISSNSTPLLNEKISILKRELNISFVSFLLDSMLDQYRRFGIDLSSSLEELFIFLSFYLERLHERKKKVQEQWFFSLFLMLLMVIYVVVLQLTFPTPKPLQLILIPMSWNLVGLFLFLFFVPHWEKFIFRGYEEFFSSFLTTQSFYQMALPFREIQLSSEQLKTKKDVPEDLEDLRLRSIHLLERFKKSGVPIEREWKYLREKLNKSYEKRVLFFRQKLLWLKLLQLSLFFLPSFFLLQFLVVKELLSHSFK